MYWITDQTRRVFEHDFGPDFLSNLPDASQDPSQLADELRQAWLARTPGGDGRSELKLVIEAMEELTNSINFLQLARAYRLRDLRGAPQLIYAVQDLSTGRILGAYADEGDAFEMCESDEHRVCEVEYLAAIKGDPFNSHQETI